MKKLVNGFLMLMVMVAVSFTGKSTQAASYETIGSFVEKVAEEIGLPSTQEAAITAGLITKDECNSWNKILTRADAAVYLDRADGILHKNTISDELVTEILEKRISDIAFIPGAKREGVARAYARGLIKGYSNGKYSTDREFRGNKKVSTSVADGWIALLKDTKNRFQISPDGQVIRTTKLPSNADLYPYILESYPNEYYDWEMYYMKGTSYYEDPEDPKHHIGIPWMYHPNVVYLKDYATPKDVKNVIFDYDSTYGLYTEIVNEKEVKVSSADLISRGLDSWVKKVKQYLTLAYSFDYTTAKKENVWYNNMISLMSGYGKYSQEYDERNLNYYLKDAINNQVKVECDKVAVDGSTLYWYDGIFYLRCYVHYRIVEAKDLKKFDSIIYNPDVVFGGVYIENPKVGEWRNGYYDVALTHERSSDVTDYGIYFANLSDHFYSNRVLDRWDGKGMKNQ